MRLDLADGLLARLGEMDEDAEAEVLAQLQILAGTRRRLAIAVERTFGHGGGAARCSSRTPKQPSATWTSPTPSAPRSSRGTSGR